MGHQEHIAKVVTTILSLPEETIEAFCRGNPFDKLLRSFDEFSSSGSPLYRKDTGSEHYKMSKAAFQSGLPARKLYGEHKIPVKIIIKRLRESDRTYATVLSILKQSEVVLITDDERKKIDGSKKLGGYGFRSSLPEDGGCRLKESGIILAPETRSNHL
jgi:hypothetical protein